MSDLDILEEADLAAFEHRRRWLIEAREMHKSRGKQLPATDLEWLITLFRCGRGFGKTRAEVEWLFWEMWQFPNLIGHAIAPTIPDVRGTLFEGDAGFCNVIPAECLAGGSLDVAYNKSLHELRLANGGLIRGFSATENGNRLRGPQCHMMICDEIAAWDVPSGNLETSMTNALLGLRLPHPDGRPARAVMGTTPPLRPVPYLKRLEKRPGTNVIVRTSYDNMANLSSSFRSQLISLAGTQAGRREIEAAYLDEGEQATIFRRQWMSLWPADRLLPEFSFIIESYDTAFSEHNWNVKKQTSDPTACIVLGVFNANAAFDEAERRRMGIKTKYAALLCEAWTDRLGFPDLLDKARKQHAIKWGKKPGRRADIVLIEEKSSGISMRQQLVVYGVPTWPFNPGHQSKLQRAHAVAPLVKQGMLFLPESALPDRKGMPRDWVEPFLEEVCGYAGPGTTEHDDQVDAMTSAMLYLRDRGLLEAKPDVETVDYEEALAKKLEAAEREYMAIEAKTRRNPYGE